MDAVEDDYLPFVMAEIKQIMSARSTVLTLHPEGRPPRVIYADAEGGIEAGIIDELLDTHIRWDGRFGAPAFRWLHCPVDEACSDILLILVEGVEGHGRLIISVFFDHLTEERRHRAELVHQQRAPFAIGYFRLWQQNRSREKSCAAMSTALNLSGMGVILLDCEGRIVFANTAADLLLTAGDALRRGKGSLRARQLGDSVKLQVAIEHVIAASETRAPVDAGRPAPLLSIERPEGLALMVSVLPTELLPEEAHDVAAIVYVMDPQRDMASLLKPVCAVYNLSRVETQLACHLIAGHTLTEAAKLMRVKAMTARSYLKQIFLKTDTHRQTELVQLMLSSVIQTSAKVVPQPF